MSELQTPKDYPIREEGNRLASLLQQVAGSLLVTTIVAMVSLGGSLWSRSSDHDNSLLRIEATQRRDMEDVKRELSKLTDYIRTVETYLGTVKERQREIELELRENSANDKSYRSR